MTRLTAIFELAEKVAEKGKYNVWFGYNSQDGNFGISCEADGKTTFYLRHVSANDTSALHMIRAKLELLLEDSK